MCYVLPYRNRIPARCAAGDPCLDCCCSMATPKPPAQLVGLDDFGEFATPAALKCLNDFQLLGYDLTDAVWRDVESDAARLLREREAFFDHRQHLDHQVWLTQRLEQLTALREKAEQIDALDPSIVDLDALRAEEQQIRRVLDRVAGEAARTAPDALKHARLAAAGSDLDRYRVHHQIPPVRWLGVKCADAHLRAIRRHFIPAIICLVHRHAWRAVAKAVERQMLAQEPDWMSGDSSRRGAFRRAHKLLTAKRANELVAGVVMAMFPFWGMDEERRVVDAAKVSMVVRNARRPTSLRARGSLVTDSTSPS